MKEIQRKKTSRKGYRSHLTCLINKANPIIDSTETLSKKQITTLTSSVEQFNERAALLRDLDREVMATIRGGDKLEAEIVESAAIQETISDKISQITSVLNAVTTPTLSASAPAFVPT